MFKSSDFRQRAREERSALSPLLERNAALRGLFKGEPALRARLEELQAWQAGRLRSTYADLLDQPRYRMAVEFFLGELYGAGDPTARDRDLLRVEHVMERLLPAQALHALTLAIELEILSQELDGDVVRALPDGPITGDSYAAGYRGADRRADRERQIDLIIECGQYLDKLVRLPLLRGLVRLARRPAHAAGFGALHEFLERGLEAFDRMGRADEFLGTIGQRERTLSANLFAGRRDPFDVS